MEISSYLINKLREETNFDYGVMDCKKALTMGDGDIIKAKEWLKHIDDHSFRLVQKIIDKDIINKERWD